MPMTIKPAAYVPFILASVLCTTTPGLAQWLKTPDPTIPRLPDGRPDLAAAPSRTPDGKPDLSGIWRWNPGRYGTDVTLDLGADDVDASARALVRERQDNLAKDDPGTVGCRPNGPRDNLVPFLLAKIVQTPRLVVVLSEDNSFRQIFLDGRSLPVDPNPTWVGYSVGRWEGDTLIVESSGFNERTWLDFAGHPHSEALRITERWRRRTVGRLEIEKTYEDRVHYARPWAITVVAELVPDTDLLEYVCENERDRSHLVGTASDGIDPAKVLKLPAAVLTRYVGTYEFRLPENSAGVRTVDVEFKDGRLVAQGNRALLPVSETEFMVAGGQTVRIQFVIDPQGRVESMISNRPGGCGGSSGVAASFFCGQTSDELIARRRAANR
jgi:hypothetical protein